MLEYARSTIRAARLAALLAVAAAAAIVLPRVPAHPPPQAPDRLEPAGPHGGHRLILLAGYQRPLAARVSRSGRTYLIRPGDTLGAISESFCGTRADYPGLAAANGIGDPDLIYAWHAIRIVCQAGGFRPGGGGRAIRHASSGGRVWGITYGYPNFCGDGDGDGWDVSCSTRHHHESGGRHLARAAVAVGSYRAAPGSFESCVIARESGGRADAVNPTSGAGGLYGFLPSTWHALGYSGLPEYAPAWLQHQAFEKEYAIAGTSPWSPYDHC